MTNDKNNPFDLDFGNSEEFMKNAQSFYENMQKTQEEIVNLQAKGGAGGDKVTVTLNGAFDMTALDVDDSLFKGDKLVMADMIRYAYNDARRKLEETLQKKMMQSSGLANLQQELFKSLSEGGSLDKDEK